MESKIRKLEKILNIKFTNSELLYQAITHKSYDYFKNYEKLEFLGDRVLGLIISKKLLKMYPEDNEGSLDKKLASLVNRKKCFEISKKFKLSNYIITGNLKNKKNLIESKIVSDACEALIGAIYLDQGFDSTEKFIINFWKDHLKVNLEDQIDSKTKLQEYSLKKYKSLPIYKLLNSVGPHHKPIFKVGVKLKDSKFVYAQGNSKKESEQKAAKLFLKKIGL